MACSWANFLDFRHRLMYTECRRNRLSLDVIHVASSVK